MQRIKPGGLKSSSREFRFVELAPLRRGSPSPRGRASRRYGRPWVNTQRSRFTKGTLEAEREHRLQALPSWTWKPHADKWEEGFNRLQDYVERTGHARAPTSYTNDGYRLGQWVNTQRSRYTKGTLDAERQHRLENLPGWSWGSFAERWEGGFSRLQEYVKWHGDACVPQRYVVDGSMATDSALGSTISATCMPEASLTPSANACWRICPAGHGTFSRSRAESPVGRSTTRPDPCVAEVPRRRDYAPDRTGPQQNFPRLPAANTTNPLTCCLIAQPSQLHSANVKVRSSASRRSTRSRRRQVRRYFVG
jgi:hypothetical protein